MKKTVGGAGGGRVKDAGIFFGTSQKKMVWTSTEMNARDVNNV